MPKRTSILIGKWDFPSKDAARLYIQGVYSRTENEKPLSGEDADFTAALLALHPEFQTRTAGKQIKHFTVSTAKGGTRCFYVVFSNGDMLDFSYKKCLG